MRLRLIVTTVLLVSVSVSLCFLFSGLSAACRPSSDGSQYVVERITRSRFRDMTAWNVPIEERLRNSLGFQPNSDESLVLYQAGVNGSEVWLFDTTSGGDRLTYRLSDVPDPALVFDYRFGCFWVGTYDGVIITEFGGEVGPYKVFYYDLGSAAIRELPASLFTHPERNLNSEGVLGSPAGSPLLVVESAEDAQADGLYLFSLSGEQVAKVHSGQRGTFGVAGISSKAILYEAGSTICLYDLGTHTSTLVPVNGLAMTPAFRPGPNSVTFVERDPRDQALYLREYKTDGTGKVDTLLKLAEGESYCWSVDGRKLFVIDEHN